MRAFVPALVLAGLLAVQASTSDYVSAKSKIQAIEKQRAPARVTLSEAELNAWIRGELPDLWKEGLRNPRVELNNGTASGYALVNFARLKQAGGDPPGWFTRALLDGEKPVSVTTRVRTHDGMAQVDVDNVTVSGIPIEGAALDFLIRNFVRARYPEAKIGQPFEMGYGMQKLELKPDHVTILMRK